MELNLFSSCLKPGVSIKFFALSILILLCSAANFEGLNSVNISDERLEGAYLSLSRVCNKCKINMPGAGDEISALLPIPTIEFMIPSSRFCPGVAFHMFCSTEREVPVFATLSVSYNSDEEGLSGINTSVSVLLTNLSVLSFNVGRDMATNHTRRDFGEFLNESLNFTDEEKYERLTDVVCEALLPASEVTGGGRRKNIGPGYTLDSVKCKGTRFDQIEFNRRRNQDISE